jgi:hypothetical protein
MTPPDILKINLIIRAERIYIFAETAAALKPIVHKITITPH